MQIRAQNLFRDETSSENYFAKITVEKNTGGICSGKGQIVLFNKITEQKVQEFSSPALDFAIEKNQIPVNKEISLGKYQSPIVFGDFNFDGFEDIAIRNGSNAIYIAASYDIYLFDKNQFIKNKDFSDLASNNLGLFSVDKKKKQLTASQKEGCCYYKDLTYQVINTDKLLLVKTVIEDATIGENVTVVTQDLINGKMKTTVKTYKINEYYNQ